MIEGNFAIAVATVDLHKALLRAPLANPTGEYQQPNHIPSLGDFEKQRVLSAFRSMEQRAHFEYLLNRRDASHGRYASAEAEVTSGFKAEARRKLEKFFRIPEPPRSWPHCSSRNGQQQRSPSGRTLCCPIFLALVGVDQQRLSTERKVPGPERIPESRLLSKRSVLL